MKLVPTIAATVLAIIWIAAGPIRAGEINLPNIGTDVNYDYALSTPQFVIATNAPSEELIHSEVNFADNKYLFVEFESGTPIVQIDLEFRGAKLYELFEPLFISFDETLSLVLENGAVSSPTRNTGIGYYNDDPDHYIFSWTLLPDANFSLHGLQWTISPDLIAAAVLPATVDIRISFFAGGAIWVVPEPPGVVGLLVAAIGACTLRRRCTAVAVTS